MTTVVQLRAIRVNVGEPSSSSTWNPPVSSTGVPSIRWVRTHVAVHVLVSIRTEYTITSRCASRSVTSPDPMACGVGAVGEEITTSAATIFSSHAESTGSQRSVPQSNLKRRIADRDC